MLVMLKKKAEKKKKCRVGLLTEKITALVTISISSQLKY